MRRLIIPLLLALSLASCVAGQPSANRVAPEMPRCAPAGAAISLPAELSTTFPLPGGTVLDRVHESSAGATVISGFIPMQLSEAARFFIEEIPRAGYELGPGDGEQDEAEATFSGLGIDGQWKVHSIMDCGDAVTLTLAFIRV